MEWHPGFTLGPRACFIGCNREPFEVVYYSKDLLWWGVDMFMWPTASVHNSSPVALWDSKVSTKCARQNLTISIKSSGYFLSTVFGILCIQPYYSFDIPFSHTMEENYSISGATFFFFYHIYLHKGAEQNNVLLQDTYSFIVLTTRGPKVTYCSFNKNCMITGNRG